MNMNKYLTALALAAALSAGNALAAGSAVRTVDLAGLTDDQLAVLRESEFEAFRAEVEYERARLLDSRVDGYIKEAKARRKVADLNAKAARAELAAAEQERKFSTAQMESPVVGQVQERARTTPDRQVVARTGLDRALLESKQADLHVDWRTLDAKATDEYIDVAKARLAVVGLDRDIARAQALQAAESSVAKDYDIGKFERSRTKAQAGLRKQEQQYAKRREAADVLRAEYQRLSDQALPAENPIPG